MYPKTDTNFSQQHVDNRQAEKKTEQKNVHQSWNKELQYFNIQNYFATTKNQRISAECNHMDVSPKPNIK